MVAFWREWCKKNPGARFEAEDTIICGNRAVARWIYSKARNEQPWHIHPALGPEPGDVVVTKYRVSAFTGTDLEMLLRARNTETIVRFGIATSGVVLSTLLNTCDADCRAVVIADCCVDLDAELHGVLLNKLFPQCAEILTETEFVRKLQPISWQIFRAPPMPALSNPMEGRQDPALGEYKRGFRFTAGSDAIALRGHKPTLPRGMGAPVACSNMKILSSAKGAQRGVLFLRYTERHSW